MAALAAAAAGGVVGSVVGAGLLHGHMWAEYNPIRVALHPSHSADVGCFRMDVDTWIRTCSAGSGTPPSRDPSA